MTIVTIVLAKGSYRGFCGYCSVTIVTIVIVKGSYIGFCGYPKVISKKALQINQKS